MNTEPTKPNSKPFGRHDGGAHPVLARLPNVGDEPLAQQRAAAGFVDYRFDMPVGAEDAEPRPRLRVQQPAYQRPPRREFRSRAASGPSRALPGSNPFAIPSTSMIDRLAPMVRFLTLFLLFTAIGTILLSTRRERSNRPEDIRPPSAAAPASVEQKLEPTTENVHPTIATPKAFGPLGANAETAADESSRLVDHDPPTAPVQPTTSAERSLSLAGANGQPLPKVQTTELAAVSQGPATASETARFTGNIHANDDTQPDAPKPAVARRLPTIFDAPPNAYQ